MSFHVGQTFGDYFIKALVGAGGMGRVYKVEHLLTKRTEAMKVLAAELATENQIKRFEREMRVLARLSHPNIASLHNAHYWENQLILFVEFVDGQTLESIFNAGRLPLETGIEYIKQILSALAYAHQQGVVHRDVTPANVMIAAGDKVKLTDFGLSKSYGDPLLTNCGEVLGSLPYLAPEQLKGSTRPDRRSDLYSVGAILYEHLTGRKAFGENRRLSAVLNDTEDVLQPPSQLEPTLARRWDEIIRRTLAKDPAHRYQSAEEFLEALANLDEPVEVNLPIPRLRSLGMGIAVFAGLVLAVVGSPVLSRFRQETNARAPRQQPEIAPAGLAILPPAFAITPQNTSISHPALGTVTADKPASPQDAKRAEVRIVRPAVRSASSAEEASLVQRRNAVTNRMASSSLADPAENNGQGVSGLVANTEEVDASQSPTPPKKRFWSRLNVFKRKNADAQDKQ